MKKDNSIEKETARVRNRDVPLLARVLYTMQDINATEQKRLWQQDRLWNITAKLTGMPGGHGKVTGLDEAFAEITELEATYEDELKSYNEELRQAETILNSIKSRTMRTFVLMKYVMDIPNNEIMGRLNMKRRTFENACKSIEGAQDMASVIWPERYVLEPSPC